MVISPEVEVRRKEALETAGGYDGGWCRRCRLMTGRTAQGAKPRKLRPSVDTWILVVQLSVPLEMDEGGQETGSQVSQFDRMWREGRGSPKWYTPWTT